MTKWRNMMKLKKLLIIASVLTIAGCGEVPVKESTSDGQQVTVNNQTLKGEVTYRERKLLPPGVTLKIILEDVSKMDVASKVIAQTSSAITGAPPYTFSLDYNKALIDSKMRYSVRAKLLLGEKLLFTSTEQLDPFKTPSDNHQIALTMVQRSQPKVNHKPETGLAVVSVNPLAELTNTYWKLTQVGEQAVVMPEKQSKEAYLQLQPDGKAKGFSGCNIFNGSYQQKGNDLSFSPMMSTKKACIAGMDTEASFMLVIGQINYYSIHKDILSVLNDKKQKIAEFKAIYFN
jgi:putative lipoprotein